MKEILNANKPVGDETDNFIWTERSLIEDQVKAVDIIKSSSMLMKLLNGGMLNLTLLKLGQKTFPQECVSDLFPALQEFSEFFKDSIEQKSLKLTIQKEPSGDEASVKLFKERGVGLNIELYQQILSNIFSNACKFNNDDGQIEMRVIVRPMPMLTKQYDKQESDQGKDKLQVIT